MSLDPGSKSGAVDREVGRGGTGLASLFNDAPLPIPAFYRAYLDGETEAMIALLHEEVRATFVGHARLEGKRDTVQFVRFSSGLFQAMDFRPVDVLVDSAGAAVAWEEVGVTAGGEPWAAHGVDVLTVRDGKIVELVVSGDFRQVRRCLPPYPGPGGEPRHVDVPVRGSEERTT